MADLPARFAGLPLVAGVPVPFTAAWKEDRPDFHNVDPARIRECAVGLLCGVCGAALDYWIVFIGGELSVESRLFKDPPMHEECARWSMRNCPYLANKNRLSPIADRPPSIAMYFTRHFRFVGTKDGRQFFKAAPSRRVEWVTVSA